MKSNFPTKPSSLQPLLPLTMAKNNLHLQESEFSTKTKNLKSHLQKINGISFWAFIFSILIYIFIFYIFNLSPSTVINTTKFWFFISNTLILIIAADFGAFTSSTKRELEENYAKNVSNSVPTDATSQCLIYFKPDPIHMELDSHLTKKIRQRNVLSFEYQQNPKIVEKIIPQEGIENPEEKIKDIVSVHESTKNVQPVQEVIPTYAVTPQQSELEIAVKNKTEKELELAPKSNNEAGENKKNEYSNYVRRSKSDREITFANDEKKNQKSVLRRTQTKKHEINAEDNEFSTMSKEELNRRVEDFIQRFNMQIRLQAARNRQSLDVY